MKKMMRSLIPALAVWHDGRLTINSSVGPNVGRSGYSRACFDAALAILQGFERQLQVSKSGK